MLAAIALVVFAPMILEAVRAARNERARLASGGAEPPDDVYAAMRLAYPAAFAAMIIESALRGGVPMPAMFAGATMFAFAKALKWWAITTLGSAWTFRVIVIPRTPLVSGGPYRFLRHPNYVAVVGELVGTALMTGAIVAGPVAMVVFGALLAKRIAVEDRALEAAQSPARTSK